MGVIANNAFKIVLVAAIGENGAIGYRGHGVSRPELVSGPLGVPSTVQRAVETRAVSEAAPPTAAPPSRRARER